MIPLNTKWFQSCIRWLSDTEEKEKKKSDTEENNTRKTKPRIRISDNKSVESVFVIQQVSRRTADIANIFPIQ